MNRRFFLFASAIVLLVFPVSFFAQSTKVNDNIPTQLMEEANIVFQKGDFRRAEVLWSEILNGNSLLNHRQQAFAYLQRSICMVRLQRDSLALQDVTGSLTLFQNADAYFVRSGIYVRQKLITSALQDIEKAIELVPDKGEYYLLRGNIRFQNDQKSEGCDDIVMAKTLGVAIPDDIAYTLCEQVGMPVRSTTTIDSTLVPHPPASPANSVADASMKALLVQTNNLNTTYYLFSIQALYGRTATMLSRLFYDTEPGSIAMVNVSFALSREFSLWGGVLRSSTPYTFGSERSQISPNANVPFGSVVSTIGLLGGRYSLAMSNNVDAQLDGGIGYRYTTFPTDVPIPLNNGTIRRANLGIRESSGLALQTSFGIEWRILNQLAITGNILFGLSFSQYNFLTISRRDQENMHQFLSYAGGIRFYLFERTQ